MLKIARWPSARTRRALESCKISGCLARFWKRDPLHDRCNPHVRSATAERVMTSDKHCGAGRPWRWRLSIIERSTLLRKERVHTCRPDSFTMHDASSTTTDTSFSFGSFTPHWNMFREYYIWTRKGRSKKDDVLLHDQARNPGRFLLRSGL